MSAVEDEVGLSPSASPRRFRAPRIFYGWWIVAGSFVLQALVGGLLFQAFGAYFVYLKAEFGWSRTVLSGAFSLGQMESGFLGPLQGWLVERLGPRAIIRVGVVLFGTGLIVLSRVDSVAAFYVAVLVAAVGSGLSGFVTVNTMLAHWFERRRATAMGLASTGWGAAGLLVPVVAWSLNTFGWRTTALYSGLLVIVVGLPVAQLMRRAPEHYGYLPDGVSRPQAQGPGGGAEGAVGAPSSAAAGFTLREALRSPAFWFLNAGHGMALLVVSAVILHLIPYLVDQMGMSLAAAAGVMALLTALSIVGQVVGGFLGDRMEIRLIAAGCMVGHMVGLLALAVAASFPLVLFFAVVHGLAWGARGPLMSAIRADYFGRGSFAMIFGFSSMVVTLGFVLGPIFAGFMADRLGDYRLGFAVLALMAGAGSTFFVLARRPALPRRAGLEPAPTIAR